MPFFAIQLLHILNDGFRAGLVLLLPFMLGWIADNYGIVTAFNFAAIIALLAIPPTLIFKKLSSTIPEVR